MVNMDFFACAFVYVAPRGEAQLNGVLESIKPINLIKDTFKAVTASPDLKNGIGKFIFVRSNYDYGAN